MTKIKKAVYAKGWWGNLSSKLEHSLAVPYRFLSKKNRDICPQKDLHQNVHNSFICNIQMLETTQMSINR